MMYGYTNVKLPKPLSERLNHGALLFAYVALLVGMEYVAVPLGGTYRVRLGGTLPPIATVTVMVCGASTAFGSLTVTMPVAVPAGSELVFNDRLMGRQVCAARVLVQAREAPTAAA